VDGAGIHSNLNRMAWIALSADAFRDRVNGDEYDGLLAESPTPDTKIATALSEVALEIVSRVNAGRRKRGLAPALATGLFVPAGAVRHAYTLVLRTITNSFPGLATYNGENRSAASDAAEKYLEDLGNNNADSDDAGAAVYASSTVYPVRYGGRDLLDFITVR
jgi:hypothetical protein